jgi:hypothetical protein
MFFAFTSIECANVTVRANNTAAIVTDASTKAARIKFVPTTLPAGVAPGREGLPPLDFDFERAAGPCEKSPDARFGLRLINGMKDPVVRPP